MDEAVNSEECRIRNCSVLSRSVVVTTYVLFILPTTLTRHIQLGRNEDKTEQNHGMSEWCLRPESWHEYQELWFVREVVVFKSDDHLLVGPIQGSHSPL